MTTAPTYQDLAARKRAEQLSLIPPEWRFAEIPSVDSVPNALPYIRKCLTPTELALTEETDITILLRKLSSGELSSLELTSAFAKRAALAHQLTTCCTEILFEEAFATAKKMDEYLEKTGKTLGPLHGLPVSIKDLFSVKGVDTSIGAYSPPSSPSPHLTQC
jgi:amidase